MLCRKALESRTEFRRRISSTLSAFLQGNETVSKASGGTHCKETERASEKQGDPYLGLHGSLKRISSKALFHAIGDKQRPGRRKEVCRLVHEVRATASLSSSK